MGSTSGSNVPDCQCAGSGCMGRCSFKVFPRMCYWHVSRHLDRTVADCHCISSDRTGIYVHALADWVSPLPPGRLPSDIAASEAAVRGGGGTTGVLSASESTNILSVRPSAIPFVFHRAGAYRQLLLATYERRTASSLSACDWLKPVTRVPPPANEGCWLTSADYAVLRMHEEPRRTHHLVVCAWPRHTYFLTTAAAAS